MSLRREVNEIIRLLADDPESWVLENNYLNYIGKVVTAKEIGSDVVTYFCGVIIGKWLHIPRVHVNYTIIPIFNPILHFRLRLAVRRFLVKQLAKLI